VSNNGDICVNTLKKDWEPTVTLAHIFKVIRCLLIIPFPESSLNDEAGKLFMESYDEFAKRARIMTKVHSIPVSAELPNSFEENNVNATNTTPINSVGDDKVISKRIHTSSGATNNVFKVVDSNVSVASGEQGCAAVAEMGGLKTKKLNSGLNAAKDAKKKSLKRL